MGGKFWRNCALICLLTCLVMSCSTSWAQDGKIDRDFLGGIISRDLGRNDGFTSVVSFKDSIVAGGFCDEDLILYKIDDEDHIDMTFGEEGLLSIDMGGIDCLNVLTVDGSKDYLILAGTVKKEGTDIFLAQLDGQGKFNDSFGNGGRLILDMGSDYDDIQDIMIDENGKILAAGKGMDNMAFIARFMPDGTADKSFGEEGVFWSKIENTSFNSIDVDDDENIVACGSRKDMATYNGNFLIMNVTPDGSLNRNFAETGWMEINLGGPQDELQKVIVQTDGKLLFLGQSSAGSANKRNGIVLTRLFPDGNEDLFFSDMGRNIVHIGDYQTKPKDMLIMDDGRILLTGSCGDYGKDDLLLARFLPDGSLDRNFGEGGILIEDFGAKDCGLNIVLSKGHATIAGSSNKGGSWSPKNDSLLVRFDVSASKEVSLLKDEKLIEDFGRDGVCWIDFGASDNCNSMVASEEGTVILGYSGNGEYKEIVLSKIDETGKLIDTFGTDGKTVTSIGKNTYGYDISSDGNGGFYVAGAVDDDFALLHYNSDGTLDRSFGDGGYITTDFGYREWGRMIEVLDDGKIVVAGQISMDPRDPDKNRLGLARYTSEGKLDDTFGFKGLIAEDLKLHASLSRLKKTDDGGIIGVGNITKEKKVYPYPEYAPNYYKIEKDVDLLLIKYDEKGQLDGSFGRGGLVSRDFSGNDYGKDLLIEGDKIIVTGQGNKKLLLAQFDQTGNVIDDFGTEGSILLELEGKPGLAQSPWGRTINSLKDGRFIVTGDISGSLLASCFKEDGTLDKSFGRGGVVSTDFGSFCWGITSTIDEKGNLLIGGTCRDDFMIACYKGPFAFNLDWQKAKITGGSITAIKDDLTVEELAKEEIAEELETSLRDIKIRRTILELKKTGQELSISLEDLIRPEKGADLAIFSATEEGLKRIDDGAGNFTCCNYEEVSSKGTTENLTLDLYLVSTEAKEASNYGSGGGCHIGFAPLSILLVLPILSLRRKI